MAGSLQMRRGVALAPMTTLRIGGAAQYFVEVRNEDELLEAVRFAREQRLRIFILGGGSNLLVADAGFAGLVVRLGFADEIVRAGELTRVPAGYDWDAFTRVVCAQGISGIECLAGIPGTVGASPIQNIGAYGQEVAATIAGVRALDLETLAYVELAAAECGFAYRTSIFNSTQRGRYVVTRVDFRFDQSATPNLAYADLASLRGTGATPLEVYDAVRAIRDRKGMLLHETATADTRSAGSFFKNPLVPAALFQDFAGPHWPAADGQIKLAAAWLIEQAGFAKGFAETPGSNVGISSRHTLALVNRSGDATCAELLALRDRIVATVRERFGVTLEQEPVYLS